MDGAAIEPRKRPAQRAGNVLAAVLLLGTVVTAVWTLWAYSTPFGDWIALVLGAAIWLMIGAVWLVSILALVLSRQVVRWRLWLVSPLIVLATLAAIQFELPMLARFAASRPGFEALIGQSAVTDQTVGMYDIRAFRRTPFGIQFEVSCVSLLTCTGFAYSPGGPPGPEVLDLIEGVTSYRHVDGPWYVWALRYT